MHIHSDSHKHHLICLKKKKKGIIRTKGWVNPNTNQREQKKRRKRKRVRIDGFVLKSSYVLSMNLNVKVKE